MTQAQRIFDKCGGAANVAKWIGYNRTSVYKWTRPRIRGGNDGYIPSHVIPDIILAAELHGIQITCRDLYPELPCS